jgi:hypothetical protein
LAQAESILFDASRRSIGKTYAVPHSNAVLPAAAWYLSFFLFFVFSLAERKNEK